MDYFKFFLYRLNKEYRSDMFSNNQLKGNDDNLLKQFFKSITIDKYDLKHETETSRYIWSLRNFQDLDKKYSSVILARSTLDKESTIITKDSITSGISHSSPAPADTIVILIYWPRHLVIVEHRAGMSTGETWIKKFDALVNNSITTLEYPILPRFEPIPDKGTLLNQLLKFDKIFRFKIRLRLPNPDLSRFSKKVHDEMIKENLQEYAQEFYSPEGIRKEEGSKAHSSAAMAELGYKSGNAKIEGIQNGQLKSIDEGKSAIKGKIAGLKEFVKGLSINIKSKDANTSLTAITDELNRLFPQE